MLPLTNPETGRGKQSAVLGRERASWEMESRTTMGGRRDAVVEDGREETDRNVLEVNRKSP